MQAQFQVIIRAGNWVAAELEDKTSYAFTGCTVHPGFEFSDFELAERNKLANQYKEHKELINRLTR